MKSTMSHLSAFTIDALAVGALAAAELEAARAHLAGCPRCRADSDEAEAARRRFTTSVMPRTIASLRRRSWWSSLLRPAFVLAPIAAVAVLALMLGPWRGPQSGEPSIGIKGGPSLQAFARRSGRIFAVTAGTALAPGDEVRFAVAPAGLRYLLLVSVDGSGKANVYYPFDGAASAALDPGARVELPGSVVLDTAPGPERIFALFSNAPLPAGDVTAALRQLGARGTAAIRAERVLAVACPAQVSLLFEKRP